MRVIVTGGRDYEDARTVADVLKIVHPDAVVVHGECPTGADAWADLIWKNLGGETDPHPADWDGYAKMGRRSEAGPARNEVMAAKGADLCIAFPGGRGTEDMIRRAKAHLIPVVRVDA